MLGIFFPVITVTYEIRYRNPPRYARYLFVSRHFLHYACITLALRLYHVCIDKQYTML